jgi:hypothetical protein
MNVIARCPKFLTDLPTIAEANNRRKGIEQRKLARRRKVTVCKSLRVKAPEVHPGSLDTNELVRSEGRCC